MLSAVDHANQKVAALEAGVDDYVVKPCRARWLVPPVQAVPRRADAGRGDPVIAVDGTEVDLAAHAVCHDGGPLHLTPIEYDLLRAW